MKQWSLGVLALVVMGCSAKGGSLPDDDSGIGPADAGTSVVDTGSSAEASTTCSPGQIICSSGCTDTKKDRENCGACGMACKMGELCSAGACATSCGGGTTQCGMICADLKVDPGNCGMCGKTCAQGEVCGNGMCGSTCAMGQTKCGGDGGPPYCANTQSDNANCGACGKQCKQGEVCANGTCAVSCPMGQIVCGGNCTDPKTSNLYCGASSDCMGNNAGKQCPMGQTCQNGTCTASCMAPLIACNNVCVDPRNDPSNCSACNNVCPQPANSVGVCSNKICGFVCNANYANCNNQANDGCEVSLGSDKNNCGQCGNKCGLGLFCSAGSCQPNLVGSYNVINGPPWGNNPPTYTCQEACALLFGGSAATYGCGTASNSITRTANTSIWGVSGCSVVADTFKKAVNYNCGSANCSQSAYVQDNCSATNYCFQ